MYERSAIVLERYIEKILGSDKQYNLKNNYNNFKELIEELENYQIITTKEGKIIQEFDDTVRRIESIQKEQEKLYKANLKLEEDRNQLFGELDEDASLLENKFNKIEMAMEKNNEELKDLRCEFIKLLSDFAQRQKERNKCEKARRLGEANHIEYVKKSINEFNSIDVKDVINLKQLINSEKEIQKQEISNIMIKNGKNEKVGFNQDVLKMAIDTRMNIGEREADCYISIYDKMKRLLAEIDNDNLKLNKYKKVLRDISVKLAFLNVEKEYIVGFLDYERMTAISGAKVHKKMMEEACKNFELDIIQINNLYELILREISNKATKKAYKELYNKTYLKNIEDKEKNFEEEVNNIKINMGTVINQNYWRIEGIKNVYDVFQNEISEKFEKDLSEFRNDEIEESEIIEKQEEKNHQLNKNDNNKDDFRLVNEDIKDEYFDDNDFEEDESDNNEFNKYNNKYEEYDEEENDEDEEDDFFEDDDDIDFEDEEDEYNEDYEYDNEDYYKDSDNEYEEYDEDEDENEEDDFFEDDDEIDFEDEEDEYDEEYYKHDNEEDEDDTDLNDEFFEEDDENLYEEDDENSYEEDDNSKEFEIINENKRNMNRTSKDKNIRKGNKTGKRVAKREAKSNKGIFDKIFKDKKEKNKHRK